jgi:hypothetical protein
VDIPGNSLTESWLLLPVRLTCPCGKALDKLPFRLFFRRSRFFTFLNHFHFYLWRDNGRSGLFGSLLGLLALSPSIVSSAHLMPHVNFYLCMASSKKFSRGQLPCKGLTKFAIVLPLMYTIYPWRRWNRGKQFLS